MRVLLIDDEQTTAATIETRLKSEGIVCDTSDHGAEGVRQGSQYHYDAILLDLMLPDLDGYEVLRRLRSARVRAPVLILSALDKTENRVKGLGLGADDFLVKPFKLPELVARIHALVRRARESPDSIIRTGQLSVDVGRQTAEISGKPLELTNKEFGILELLSLRKGAIVTQQMLLNHLYRGTDIPKGKILPVFICHLRHKLSRVTNENYIETVPGRGYVLRDPSGRKEAIRSPIPAIAQGEHGVFTAL